MKKAGKAHRAAKQKAAAKHRARQHQSKEARREHRSSRRPAAGKHGLRAAGLGAPPSGEVAAALRFCRDHDMAPSVALQQLLDGGPLRVGMSAFVVEKEPVRAELIKRLAPVVFAEGVQ